MQKPNVVYKLEGITEVMELELKEIVDKNLEGKMESTLKKVYAKWADVEVMVKITVSKMSEWYNGSFKFEFDGKSFEYDREWFEILSDLVNHAFDNFKQRILAK